MRSAQRSVPSRDTRPLENSAPSGARVAAARRSARGRRDAIGHVKQGCCQRTSTLSSLFSPCPPPSPPSLSTGVMCSVVQRTSTVTNGHEGARERTGAASRRSPPLERLILRSVPRLRFDLAAPFDISPCIYYSGGGGDNSNALFKNARREKSSNFSCN